MQEITVFLLTHTEFRNCLSFAEAVNSDCIVVCCLQHYDISYLWRQ